MKETSDDVKNQKEDGNFLKNLLKEKEPKTSEFVGTIIVNIVLLYIVNNVLSWNLSFITSSFQDVIWIFNISIGSTIVANILFLVYHSGWFRSIIQILLNILGFMVAYFLYTVFPFVFSQLYITYAVKIVLIIGMIGLVIATLVEVVKLILRIMNP
ncbi:MAG: hypothetical protein FJ150_04370 [Euryarchaeota archaeon]|nr:hypothetical protein [Euryarchaeota archaeon]